mmetsp:Transcript_27880/g.80543  ORF Transcript_27880/g.80543 Transcript_27880/m.80543 type:complete len:583 (+) Transcript_27880:351-2099(+)
MQRYPSIARDYRAGGGGAAPAGGSYRGNRTSGEVPQWLVDTCNEDNEYAPDVRDNPHAFNFSEERFSYEGSGHDGVGCGEDDYGDSTGMISDVPFHQQADEGASRKSSLDTTETFRADNTAAGISYRQQSQPYNESSHNFDYNDADAGRQQPYMFEPYESQERSQVEDLDYQSITNANRTDYYEDDSQYPHPQKGTSNYRAEQAPAPQRQTFEQYQRYVMDQQQYLPSNKSGKSVVGRGILDAVGGFLTDRMSALQQQGQSRSNMYRADQPKPSMPPRQSSMRHRDGSLRGGRYQQRSERQVSRPPPSPVVPFQAPLPEKHEHTSRQIELMMMELQGDAVPLRGGGSGRVVPQRRHSRRPVKQTQPHWDSSNSGSRFTTRGSSVQSSESSLSSLSSGRALRYHEFGFEKQKDQVEEYDAANGQELIVGWDEDDKRNNGAVSNKSSYDMGQPPNDFLQRYHVSSPAPQPEAYQSFQDMIPRQAGTTPTDKLLGMMKTGKQVSFRAQSSKPPLVDPPGRYGRYGELMPHVSPFSEIKTKTNDGGEEVGRRFSDLTFDAIGSKSSLNASLSDSGSLSVEQIASLS